MDQFSFDFGDPIFEFAGWRMSQQIITFENTYGLDPGSVQTQFTGDTFTARAARLMWAGNQEKAAGTATLTAKYTEDGLELVAAAEHTERIRRTKIVLRGLPDGVVIGENLDELPIGDGQIMIYPEMQVKNARRLHAPLFFLKTSTGEYYYFQSLDTIVRAKTFAIYRSPWGDGVTVELLHEDLGPEMTNTTVTPPWRIGVTADPAVVIAGHIAHLKRHFGLIEWERNPLVPEWLRQVGFVAYMHGQHWTGYIFNDYAAMLRNLRTLAERLEGRRILAHLAGWEGRYYWKYGDYRPDARMGGEDGFRRLCDGAHELGIHIQVMLGGNCANRGLPGFWQWGETSYLRSAGGAIDWGNSPDWDTARAHDTPWQAWLNPGAPGWHDYLLNQARRLIDTYQVDSIFLDTDGRWANDPDHPVIPGLMRLRDELKARYPEVVLTGEHWSDALTGVTPLTHDDAVHLALWEEHFAPFLRTYAHNSWGDPSRNSTGVFEGGWTPFRLVPDARHVIPTLVIVDGTLEKAPQAVDAVVEQARGYIARYLTPLAQAG